MHLYLEFLLLLFYHPMPSVTRKKGGEKFNIGQCELLLHGSFIYDDESQFFLTLPDNSAKDINTLFDSCHFSEISSLLIKEIIKKNIDDDDVEKRENMPPKKQQEYLLCLHISYTYTKEKIRFIIQTRTTHMFVKNISQHVVHMLPIPLRC